MYEKQSPLQRHSQSHSPNASRNVRAKAFSAKPSYLAHKVRGAHLLPVRAPLCVAEGLAKGSAKGVAKGFASRVYMFIYLYNIYLSLVIYTLYFNIYIYIYIYIYVYRI